MFRQSLRIGCELFAELQVSDVKTVLTGIIWDCKFTSKLPPRPLQSPQTWWRFYHYRDRYVRVAVPAMHPPKRLVEAVTLARRKVSTRFSLITFSFSTTHSGGPVCPGLCYTTMSTSEKHVKSSAMQSSAKTCCLFQNLDS